MRIGIGLAVVIFIKRLERQASSLAKIPLPARAQTLALNVLGFQLRHPVGRHEKLKPLHIAFVVMAQLHKGMGIALTDPAQPPDQLVPPDLVSLARPSLWIKREAIIAQPVAGQSPAPAG